MGQVETWNELGAQLAIDSIRCTTEAGSGHPTSSISSAHLAAVLFASHIRFDFDKPHSLDNDRFVLSKGHAAPLLYAIYKAAGAITDGELMSLRKLGSLFEGHPTPRLPWVDTATGSLGQGLPIGVGMAMAGRLDGAEFTTWVLMGDSEMAEGSVWEAMGTASFYGLSRLIGILDMNRLGQRGPTQLEWNSAAYSDRAQAFGWHTIEIDGHDVEAIDRAYREAEEVADRPTLIIAKTEKGHGIPAIANKNGWHGKPLPDEMAETAIAEFGGRRDAIITVARPESARPDGARPDGARSDGARPESARAKGLSENYERPVYDAPVATREAYGDTLKALGAVRPDIVVLDGEVGNSTFANIFGDAYPERFFEMYIAEQLMVGAATGMASLGKTAFVSSFAAFLTRAYDFIRMAAVSHADLRLCGSHAGVSIGQDGPSQMGVEDVAMMRAVHGSTVLCPADGVAAVRLIETMADLDGVSYIRTARGATPLLYGADETFPIGGSKIVREVEGAAATVVGMGVTVYEALSAADQLASDGVEIRVIDAYSVKPIDSSTLAVAARETGSIVTVEDHHPEGGLAEAVLGALASEGASARFCSLAVRNMPGSGSPEELRAESGISAASIVDAVRALI